MTELTAFRVVQGSMVVARVEAADAITARRQADHYAAMYVEDGPVMVQERKGRRWDCLYVMANEARGATS